MTGKDAHCKIHILVVEDNPGDIALFRMALQSAGLDCKLTVIEGGEEAITFVEQRDKYANSPTPDLAILDLNLPQSDGLEILSAMRGNRAFDSVPVAVLTSSSSPRQRAEIEKFRIGRYVTKPPDLEEYLKIGLIVKELLVENGSAE